MNKEGNDKIPQRLNLASSWSESQMSSPQRYCKTRKKLSQTGRYMLQSITQSPRYTTPTEDCFEIKSAQQIFGLERNYVKLYPRVCTHEEKHSCCKYIFSFYYTKCIQIYLETTVLQSVILEKETQIITYYLYVIIS